MRKAYFNNRLHTVKETEDRVYLTDISDNKIKVNVSFSKKEEDHEIARKGLEDFWSKEIFGE